MVRDYQNNSNFNIEGLISIYINSNYYSLVNGNFSWATFILGWGYLLYRKVYKNGLFLMLLSFLLFALFFWEKSIGFWGYWIVNFIFALKFKKKYLLKCQNDVNKIVIDNFDKSYDELLQICKKRGGVDKRILILNLLILLIIPLTLIFMLTSNRLAFTPVEGMKYVDSVSYFNGDYLYSDIYFEYESDVDKCAMVLTSTTEYGLKMWVDHMTVAESYYKKNVGYVMVSNIYEIESNDIKFQVYYDNKSNIYYYFNANIFAAYIIKFDIEQDGTGKCSELNSKVLESVHYGNR